MNKTYRLIWNVATANWVAVSECARGRGKQASGPALVAGLVVLLPLLAAAQTPPAPNTLPSGGRVVGGQAAISQSGATLNIQQSSERAAIDWNRFDVGNQAQVNFQQPSAKAVALNRVQSADPSQIFGRINANGQVFLSNPAGVYFAPGASVDVGGLVATSHRIDLDDFMAGRVRFERAGATGSVVNAGELHAALGGYIALLAPEVRNEGVILARLGTVALAAGEAFELQFDNGRNLAGLRVERSTIRSLVDNRNAVLAPGGLVILSAQAMDRVQGGVVRNSGRIEATGLAQRGGRIVLEASDSVANSGSIDASATAEGPAGSVRLQAPEVVQSGNIAARGSAEHPVGGQVEIVAERFTQEASGRIDVSAPAQGGTVVIRASERAAIQGRLDAAARSVRPAPAKPQPAPAKAVRAAPAPTAIAAAPATPAAAPVPDIGQGGTISVRATQITLADARLDASGRLHGGQITLDATPVAPEPAPLPAPEPQQPGQIAILGNSALNVRGRRGNGGAAKLLGDQLDLDGSTRIDATGATGGGSVRTGGGWQGGEDLYQATSVHMGEGVVIDASATGRGDGGSVVLWSDLARDEGLTTALGSILARGGAEGGDGGQVETSGHAVQTDGIRVDAGAAPGQGGQGGLWLIDPYDYTINASAASTIAGVLNSGTSVTVTTTANIPTWGSSGNNANAGNITVTNAIAKTAGGTATLTLQAARNLIVNAGIGSTVGQLNVVLWSNFSGTDGSIALNNAAITTNGGHVWMGGSLLAGGFTTWNGLTVGNGYAVNTAANSVALSLSGGTAITTSGGNVYGAGLSNYLGGALLASTSAVVMDNASIRTNAGSVTLTGNLQGNYTSGSGIDIRNNSTVASTTGAITLGGTAGAIVAPAGTVIGTYLHNKATINSTTGAINLYGTTTANSQDGAGIWLGSTFAGFGDGNQSAGGAGNGYNVAVVSTSGAVLLDGRATSTYLFGTQSGVVASALGSDRQLVQTGSGNITLKGLSNVLRADSSGVQLQVNSSTASLGILSTSGDIYVQGFQQSLSTNALTNALRLTPGDAVGSIRLGASSDGASYTGRITLEADSVWVNTANTTRAAAIKAYGSGAVTIQSTSVTSVKALALSNLWDFGSTHGAFSIGKATEILGVQIGASLTAAGPITVRGGDITLDANLTSTQAGASIQLLAAGSVYSLTNANTITTNAGAVTLAADTNGNGFGTIRFLQGLAIDTRVGLPGAKSTAGLNGGAITLGGGNAQGGGFASGVNATLAERIRVDRGFTALSGGGDIKLRGRSWAGILTLGGTAWGVGFANGTTSATLDSGTGRIRIEGIGRTAGLLGLLGTYTQGVVAQQALDIRSAYAGGDAITILGTATTLVSGWNVGIDLGANNPVASSSQNRILATGVGGGILLQGLGVDGAVALRSGAQLLANGGDLRLVGLAGGLLVGNGNTLWLGSMASSAVAASSSNLLLEFDSFSLAGRANIATSGAATIRSHAALFAQQLQTQWFNWNQNGQVIGGLTLGRSTNIGQAILIDGSNGSAATPLTVRGSVTAYGSTVTVNSPLVVSGSGDVYLQAYLDGNTSLTVAGSITKTSGADATLTLKAAGRVAVNAGIAATGAGTGKLNMVLWADADGSRLGGVAFGGDNTLASNGGHIWIGGSNSFYSSMSWNGLAVGDGASAGSYLANANGVDLRGNFLTAGGDFYVAGRSLTLPLLGTWDINATGGNVLINAGSGNVSFVGNRIDFGGLYTANVTTTVATTGVLTIKPVDLLFGYGFNIKGTVSGGDWLGTTVGSLSGDLTAAGRILAATGGNILGTANLIIKGVAGLGGLVVGSDTNAQAIAVQSNLAIAGDISLLGGSISNANGASLTSTAGSILLDGDLGLTLPFSGAGVSWSGGALTAGTTAAGRGNITLRGRGGIAIGSNNHGVVLGTGAVLQAGGDIGITGLAPQAANAGVYVAAGVNVNAGRSLNLDGRNIAMLLSGASYGVRLLDSAALSAVGTLALTAQAGLGTAQALQLGNGINIATSGTAGASGITLTALGGAIASSDATGSLGNGVLSNVTAGAGSSISLVSDRLDLIASRPLALSTTGTLSLQPSGAAFSGTFTWDGSLSGNDLVGAGSLAGIRIRNLASLGGLSIGKPGNTSNLVVNAAARAAGSVQLYGQDITLNAALTASGNATQAANQIVLNATGTVSQTAALASYALNLQGTGRFNLSASGNDVSVLAAGGVGTPVGSLNFIDANGFSVGQVGSALGVNALGTVRLETLAGNLDLAAGVATTAGGLDAVVLNAGRAKAIADADFLAGAGGNITVANGASVTAGAGGRVTLYTGQLSGSTGLTALVGAGTGRFRYASDEITSNFLVPLTSGLQAIYREQPVLTLRGQDQSVGYSAEASLQIGATGLANGDTLAQGVGRLPTVTLTAGSSAAVRNATGYLDVRRDGNGNVLGYGMALSRDAISSLGYAIAYDDGGTTTVVPKVLTAVINDDAKFLGLADTAGYAGVTISGFARGESAAHISASAAVTRSGTGEGLGQYTGGLTGSVNLAAGNYVLPAANVTAGTYSIVGAETLIVRVGAAGAIYGGPAAYDVTQVQYFDSVAQQAVNLTRGASAFSWNLAGNAAQGVNFALASAGVNVGLYGITGTLNGSTLPGSGGPSQVLAVGGRLAITPRTVSLLGNKVYDGSTLLGTGAVSIGNLVGGETLGFSAAVASDRNVATGGKHIASIVLTDGTGLASNYQLPDLTVYDPLANAVNITARQLDVSVSKVYDGLASATALQTTLGNLAAGEALTIQGVGLSSARVALGGKFVSSLSLGDLGPFLASNYSLPDLGSANAGNSVSITPLALGVGITSASNTSKTYDGTTSTGAGFSVGLSLQGLLGVDAGATLGFSAAYDSAGVDAARIRLTNLGLLSLNSPLGSVASDYTLDASLLWVPGTIVPRVVNAATAATPTKVYDGTTSLAGAAVSLAAGTAGTGLVAGDDLRIVAVAGDYNNADAGLGRSYTGATIELAGSAARNYVLGSATISGVDGLITPRQLTLSASKVYDGTTALSNVLVGNLAAGQYLTVSGAASASAHVAGPDGNVATADNFISAITLSDVLSGGVSVYKASNYTLNGTTALVSGLSSTLTASGNNQAAITPAQLSVGLTETEVLKVYDGTTGAASGYQPGYVVTGLASGDTATLTAAGMGFDAMNAGAATSFAITGLGLGGLSGSLGSLASDYSLTNTSISVLGRITQRLVTVDLSSGIHKVYDASTGFGNLSIGLTGVAGNSSSGLLASDLGAVGVVASGGGFDTKDAGTGKSYTLTGLQLTGTAALNYQIASGDSLSGLNGVIDPKRVVVSGLDAVSKVYDGTTAAVYTGQAGTLLSVAPGGSTANDGRIYLGDTVTLTGGATGGVFNSKDVGTATTVRFSGFGLSGADAANYTVVGTAVGSITPKQLTATTVLSGKTYDGSTSVGIASNVVSGLVGSEQLAIGASATLDSAHAGSRTATIGYTLGNGASGGLAANYSLAGGTRAVTVAQKVLTVAGTTVAGKVYDGNASASVNMGLLTGLVAGESLSVSATGSFDSRNAGLRSATVNYLLGSGTGLASDYTLAAQTGLAATITPKQLTVSASKVYDGTTALGAGAVTLGGFVGSETLGYAGATASSAHVAVAGKYLSAITLLDGANGGLALNYQLPVLGALSAPVTITPRQISVNGSITGQLSKTYDGTTAATGASVVANGGVLGALAGDNIVLDTSSIRLAYDSAHVASATQIAATGTVGFLIGSTSNGSLASDYVFSASGIAPVVASITPAQLTVSLGNLGISKVYDGSTDAPQGFLPTWAIAGLALGDTTATITHTGATYNSKDVTTANALTLSGLGLGGVTGGNGSAASDYTLATAAVVTPAAITPRQLTVSASKVYDGTTALGAGAVTLGGFVGSETLTYTNASVSDAHVAAPGKYLNAITLADGANGGAVLNYALPLLSALTAPVVITPRPITVGGTITGQLSKTYDGTTAATGASVASNGNVSGALAGDDIVLDTSSIVLAYNSAHVASANQIAATGSVGFLVNSTTNGSLASDYAFSAAGIAPVAAGITAAQLTATLGNNGLTKVYDGTTDAPSGFVPNWAFTGLVAGDTGATLGYTGASYNTKNVATANAVTVSGISLNAVLGSNGSAATDYTLASASVATPASITPAPLTVTAGKVYDGTTTLGAGAVTLGGLVGSETLGYSGATVSDAHVATVGKYLNSITLLDGAGGGLESNYQLPLLSALTAPVLITPRLISSTDSITGQLSKTYDGTTAATGASVTSTGGVTGALANDDIVVDTSGIALAYDSAHVATATQISAIGNLGFLIRSTGSGSLASDYAFSAASIAPVAASITPAQLTATLTNGNLGKVYDGTTGAPTDFAPLWNVVGLIAGDFPITVGYGSAAYDGKDVATATTLTVSGVALTGVASSNGSTLSDYAMASTTVAAPAAITPRALAVSASKVYDGTTALNTGDIQFANLVGGETLGATGSVTDAHVVTAGKYVNVLTLSDGANGGLAANYALPALNLLTAPVTIAPRPLSATATITGSLSKTYDGSTVASGASVVAGGGVAGGLAGDVLTLDTSNIQLAYDSANVANATQIAATGTPGFSLSASSLGSLASDYSFSVSSIAPVAASIAPRDVAVSGLTVAGKTYDGTTVATVTDWGNVATGVGNETLVVSGSSAVFADPNAGLGKTVTASGYQLANGTQGGLASNYRLASTVATATADIGRATLTVTANDDARLLAQPESPGYGGVSFSGFVNGETAAVLGGSASVVRTNAGVNAPGTYTGVLVANVSGLSTPNYQFNLVNGSYTIVPPGQLLIHVTGVNSVYGDATAYTITGAEYHDGSSVQQLSLVGIADGGNRFTLRDSQGGTASFTIVPQQGGVSGASVLTAGAYQLSASNITSQNLQNFGDALTVVGTHNVVPKSLVASAISGIDKVYDGTTAMDNLGLGLAGLLTGDVVAASGTGAFAGKNVGSNLAYTVNNLTLNGADAANYFLASGASLSGNNGSITPRQLNVTFSGVGKVYDGSSAATVTASDDRIAGDALNVAATASFADKNAGMGKSITVGGIGLGGLDAGNYTLVVNGAVPTADIARLGSVTWVGGNSGNWFNPANWAGGAVPDLANVAQVFIPAGVTVNFDTSGAVAHAQAGPVQIDLLGSAGSLVQSNGSLNIGSGGITLSMLTQSGGSLRSAGPIVLDGFSQTGGSTTVDGDFSALTSFDQGSAGLLNVLGPARIRNAVGATQLGNLQVSGDLDVDSSDGDLTQAGGTAVTVGGTASVTAGSHDITLANVGNDLGRLAASGRNIVLQDGTGGLVLGNVAASGNLAVTSAGGDVTQAGGTAVAVAGATTFAAGSSNVLLGNAGNQFGGAVTAIGQNILLANAAGGLQLGNVGASGNLDASSTSGDVTQADGTAIIVAGTTSVTAGGGSVALANAGNNFGGAVSASGRDVLLSDDVGGLTLGNMAAAGNLRATSTGGDITQTAGTAVTVAGASSLAAGANSILLGNAGNDFGGALSASGQNVTVTDGAGSLLLGNVSAFGNLAATSSGGNITQVGGTVVRAGGSTTLTAGGSDISLTNGGNDFGGAFNASGRNIALNDDTGGLQLGNVAATGNLAATSTGGDITQAGATAVTVGGTATVAAGDNDVTLGNGGNDFGGSVSASGRDITLTDGNAGLQLGNVAASGNLATTSTGGDITQAGGSAVTVAGATTVAAGGNNVTLANSGNDFGGSVNVRGRDITLTDGSSGLQFGNVAADGNLAATSTGGDVTQAAGAAVSVAGTTNVAAGAGNVVLGNRGNDFGGIFSASGQNITVADGSGGLLLGNLAAGGNLAASSSGGNIAQAADTAVTVSGASSLVAAGGNILLANAGNDFGGAVNASGRDIDLLDGRGGLLLGNLAASGNLAAASTAGDIAQLAATGITVVGTTTVAAGNGNITLANAGNDLGGAVNASGQNIAVADGIGGLVLGNINAGGTLAATSTGGSITQAAGTAVRVVRRTSVSAGGSDIALNNAANDFGEAVDASARNITLRDGTGGLVLGNIGASGTLTATSTGGGIVQSPGAQINVGGDATLNASGAIALANSGNSFGGTLTLNGDLPTDPEGPAVLPSAPNALLVLAPIMPQLFLPIPDSAPPPLAMRSEADDGALAFMSETERRRGGVTVLLDQAPDGQVPGEVTVLVSPEALETGFGFALPTVIWADLPEDAQILVTLENGDPLPDWLRFRRQDRRFQVQAAPRDVLPVRVLIVAGGRRTVIEIQGR